MCLRAFLNTDAFLSTFKAQAGQDQVLRLAFESKRTWLAGLQLYCSHQQWGFAIAGLFSPFQCQGVMPEGNDTCVTQIQHRAPCFKTLNFPVEILPVPLFSRSVHDTAKTCLFHTLWITFANRQRSAFESNIQHFSFRMGFSKLWVQFIYPLTIRVG